MARETCLSASSVNVRRLIASDDTITDMTGSASGSTFVITGGSNSGGTLLIAPATFSRTSLTASFRSRSRTNRTVMLPLPSLIRAEISSMPATPLMACSIGSITDEEISSGLAPGSDSDTFTVAGSARGNRSTPRSRNEKIPSTTSDITSIVAKTGRRTHRSDSMARHDLQWNAEPAANTTFLRARRALRLTWVVITGSTRCGDLHAIGQFVDIGDGDALAGLDAADHLNPLAEPVAHLELADGQFVAVDDKGAIHAVAVLQRRVRQGHDIIDSAAVDVNAGEGAGLQACICVRHQRFEGKRARRGIDGRADARHFADKRLARIGVHVQFHRLTVLDPRRHLLGNLGDHFQRIDPHHRHHCHLSLDQLAEVDEAPRDVAIKRRANVGVAKLAIGQFHA